MGLTDRAKHFEFGQNWRDYAKTIDQKRVDSAIAGVQKLFPQGLAGKTVLDVGCGSGLHAFAALSMGAASVTAVDIDENSVSTTHELLTRLAPNLNWSARVESVFDLSPTTTGTFDVVYSWGVLHHTGNMWRAIDKAASLVKPDGEFAVAIYNATRLDALWRAEKYFYTNAHRSLQWLFRQGFMSAVVAAKLARGRNPVAFFRDYPKQRGMNFTHDVHDWLGGYPYETSDAEEMRRKVRSLGFRETRSFVWPKTIGVFGSPCNEFVFSKASPSDEMPS